ncbi:MAG: hypothetical protein DMF99_32115 [Acidobacteria bacterium]|nr:MAG: hypothetical protein DMF99_32115 [Acidobacteriota bacterium]
MTDEALLSWIDRGQLIAALFVAVGVAGEFLLQFAARPINKRIEFARSIEVSKQQEKTANAERELLILKEKIAPRHISDEQRKALIASLKESQDKGLVRVFAQAGDSESFQYAVQIEEILKAAGWLVAPPSLPGIFPSPGDSHVGLLLGVRDPSKPPPHGLALKKAFAGVGIEMLVEHNRRADDTGVELLVNNKPM